MARNIVQGIVYRKAPKEFDANELAKVLEDAYLMQRRPDRESQKFTFSPSTVGYGHGNCPRYWYMAFTGGMFHDNTDALGIANMSYGTQAHERIEKLFEAAGILVDKEVEIKVSDPPIRGFADVLIRFNGEVVIGEIKTTRQEAFLHRQATMKPAPYHKLQILTYMKATGKRYGFLLYENKNSQEFLVIPIEMTPENDKIISDVWDWLRTVRKAWEDKTLPKCVYTKRNKICKECPFYENCWDGPEGVVDIPALEVPKP